MRVRRFLRSTQQELEHRLLILSTLLVAALVVLALLVWVGPANWVDVVASAAAGAVASALFGLTVEAFAKSDKGNLPINLIEAASNDLSTSGYFRKGCRVTIEIEYIKTPDKYDIKIIFKYMTNIYTDNPQSTIDKKKATAKLDPQYSAPRVDHLINGKEFGEESIIPIKSIAKEELTVTYYADKQNIGEIKNDHRWDCPIYWQEIAMICPVDYKPFVNRMAGGKNRALSPTVDKVIKLKSKEKLESKETEVRQVIFEDYDALFSQQGFEWSFRPVNNEADSV